MFPLVEFRSIERSEANQCLESWGHKIGAIRRPNNTEWCHGLFHAGEAVGVTATNDLVAGSVGGKSGIDLGRHNTIELARLCAGRENLNRVLLRMWREFVFVDLPYEFAVSYQDADLHTGDTYRNDGWLRLPSMSCSGTDQRSGRKGRRKWIWLWRKGGVDALRSAAKKAVSV